jgi:protease I
MFDFLQADPVELLSQLKYKPKKIMVLLSEGVELQDIHFIEKEFKNKDAELVYASPDPGVIKTWDGDHWGQSIISRIEIIDECRIHEHEYDAFIIPGEKMHMEKLRENVKLIQELNHLLIEGKTIITIGYGIQLLIDADSIHGRKVTGPRAIKKDIDNAGGWWQDQNITIDGSLITINNPELVKLAEGSKNKNSYFSSREYLSILALTMFPALFISAIN